MNLSVVVVKGLILQHSTFLKASKPTKIPTKVPTKIPTSQNLMAAGLFF